MGDTRWRRGAVWHHDSHGGLLANGRFLRGARRAVRRLRDWLRAAVVSLGDFCRERRLILAGGLLMAADTPKPRLPPTVDQTDALIKKLISRLTDSIATFIREEKLA